MTIERVFVAGAGLMGHGIAQVHAAIGLSVALYEPDLARAEAGRDRIAGNLDRSVAKGRLSPEDRDATLARIRPDRGRRRRRGRRPGHRGRLRGSRRQVGAVARARWRGAGGGDLRLEHVVDRHPPAGRGGLEGASRPVRRDALLQPGAGHAADRAHPRPRHRRRDRGGHPRAVGRARQAGHRLGRPARVHRQPDPHAVPRRGDARVRGGARDGRGHRYRRAGRPQPPDGPARARRLHRPRRLPRDHARPRRRPRPGAHASAGRPGRARRTTATSARRPVAASTPTRASPSERRPDRGGAAPPGDGPRVRDARGRARRDRARRDRDATTGRCSPGWASSA